MLKMFLILWTNLYYRRSALLITIILFLTLLWITETPNVHSPFSQSLMGFRTKQTPRSSPIKFYPRRELTHIPKERLVHLDLKGAPPKLVFLNKFIEVIAQLGATGLLIEYEDMFPFEGNLTCLSARNAYKRLELKNFLESCAQLQLKVIPLVQTFGHMEYALKLREFGHLREDPRSPQALCPSHKESIGFLTSIITQIIEFHMQLQQSLHLDHIHIGCDEVFQMAQCRLCQGQSKHQLFLEHVANVANVIKRKWPQIKIIIWDDMLQAIPEYDLKISKLGKLVEPMVWSYSARISEIPKAEMWKTYQNLFPTVWAASAFKGASPLPRRLIPPIQRHLDNNRGWLTVMAQEQNGFHRGFQGLVLSGWQRYSHFAVLCELLPAGIPSLLLSLALVSANNSVDIANEQRLQQVMKCDKNLQFPSLIPYQISEYHPLFMQCPYLCHDSYEYLLNLNDYIEKIHKYLQRLQIQDPYLTLYNVEHNFSLPSRMDEELEKLQGYIQGLRKQANLSYNYLKDVYDEFTIGEFVEQQIYSVLVLLQNYWDKAKELSKQRHWSQRPFDIPKKVKVLYGK